MPRHTSELQSLLFLQLHSDYISTLTQVATKCEDSYQGLTEDVQYCNEWSGRCALPQILRYQRVLAPKCTQSRPLGSNVTSLTLDDISVHNSVHSALWKPKRTEPQHEIQEEVRRRSQSIQWFLV
jgi:hypothetical protein